jgi:uncharacterized protein (TIGR02246 family)
MAATDREAVLSVLRELVDCWGRHDAEAFADLFTVDASYTTFMGTQYRGRKDITESHRALWAKFKKGTKVADEICDVRFVGPDTAIVTSRAALYKGRKRPATFDKVQTYTLVRDGSRWLIAAFQNTKRSRWLEAISFKFTPEFIPEAQRDNNGEREHA